MKIISVIGYSGSGKTYMIEKIIKKLKLELNLEVVVIKYIHEHQIDEEGKDSFIFSQSGAVFSIIRNKRGETAIFLKKKIEIDEIIRWLKKGPLKFDIIIFESFRNLPYPTILCVKQLDHIEEQLNDDVKMISGIISKSYITQINDLSLPIVDVENDFGRFCQILDLT